jgi:hypothetical protein
MCFTTEDSWKKEIAELRTQLAEARAAARWLLYDAPGREYAEVQTMLKQWPWLGDGVNRSSGTVLTQEDLDKLPRAGGVYGTKAQS